MSDPIVVTDPITEAVSLAEVKLQCRIDDSTSDSLLEIFRVAARKHVEWRTGRTLHQTTLKTILYQWPIGNAITLPRATPLITIDSAVYKDSGGTEHTWSADEYVADTDASPGKLVLAYGASWPSFTPYPVSPITIQYTCGIQTTSPITEVCSALKYPILLLIGAMWENREEVVVSDRGMVSQLAVKCGAESYITQAITSYVF
jgi:uncharacterized phiE125 gp8 family phage protein